MVHLCAFRTRIMAPIKARIARIAWYAIAAMKLMANGSISSITCAILFRKWKTERQSKFTHRNR